MLQLEGYEIQAEIARGAQGIVYAAREVQTGRKVAIKVLLQIDRSLMSRFEREAEVLARLRHPNVVAIHGAGRARGRPYIVMELVEGESLERALGERGAFASREAARIVRDLARGAARAHALGLVHRDIKPANALIRPDGTVLLTDFGLARDQANSSDLSKTGIFMGTPGFASPEQASGEGKRVGPASDVYGLGALLFALLCERPPVQGDLLEVVIATVSTPPPSPRDLNPEVDPDLAAICLRCLAKLPEQRYRDGAALALELERYLLGEATSESPSGPGPGPLIALGLLTALGVGGAALYALGPQDAAPILASATPPRSSPLPTSSRSPLPRPSPATTPDPALERTVRLVRAKTRHAELDAAIEILSEALERAQGASNRLPAELFLAELYARRAERVMQRGPAEISLDLRRAAALDPTPQRRAALAEALMREGLHTNGEPGQPERWRTARELLLEAMELAPEDLRMPMTLGEQARMRRDYQTALLGFEEAYRRRPTSSGAVTSFALILSKLDRRGEGLVIVRRYLAEVEPTSKGAQFVLGRLLARQGRWAEARAVLAALAKRDQGAENVRVELARIALEEERPSLSLSLVEGIRGRTFEVRKIVGLSRLALADPRRALPDLEGATEMVELDPVLVWAYLRALYWTGQHDKAGREIAALVEAGALLPIQLQFFRATHLARGEQSSEGTRALQALCRALSSQRDSWTAIQLSRHFSQWGPYHQPKLVVSLAKLAAASSDEDEDAGAWIMQAKGLSLQHRYPEARALLVRALEVHPTRVDLHYNFAKVEMESRRFLASIAAAERCLELEPLSAYAAVIGAEACIGLGRYTAAQPFLEACREPLKSNTVPRTLRAIVRVELGELKGAEEDVAWVVERDLASPRSQLAQAALFVRQGRLVEAEALAEPISRRPARGWISGYAKLLLERIRAQSRK